MLLALAAACALEVRGVPQAEVLERVPLAELTFALRYTHSVTLRAVESRYEIRDGRIVQTAEVFDEHGPGMATEPLKGERLDTVRDATGVHYVMTMQRTLDKLTLRVQVLPAQRLIVRGEVFDLIRFGERALELIPRCDGATLHPNPSPSGRGIEGEAQKRRATRQG
jgi:hypothetical protein